MSTLAHHPERLASCGRPCPFFDVRVVRDDGSDADVGEIGEVWVRGDAVSVEYWNQPEATAAAHTDGWFRMGDLATRDADGYITIVDRKNDMIISGGLNVYPREVEDVIAELPAVNEVAVIGVPHAKWGEAVHACVSLRPGGTVTLEELQRHCVERGLGSYKKPLSFEIVDDIPKTAVGKVFRRVLRERHWAGRERAVG
ncbi:class I adenylate-forming enzyme family protein [Pseudonocardia thermophila]|uniref:class I adenylate-forming enzyme family protein n=1 Tax=Pseudonocardia thermophila TaxID=1848 RepID=UPI0009377DCA|nr:AMP-binding protein [Pseudonocardia thermophila]